MITQPIRSVLIANRGEIALRIARTCRELGIRTVAVCSSADLDSAVARYADETAHIGPPAAKRSYLYLPSLIETALRYGVDAIHPGYGFLSEDPDFAQICAENGIVFVGPPPAVMEELGDKARTRVAMRRAGLPVLPGSDGAVPTVTDAIRIAGEIGFPVVLKAAAGGGGRGIQVVHTAAELPEAYRRTVAQARQIFGNGDVYLERFLSAARHVEVQLLADGHGTAVSLGERDCSLQRRHQKLVEEAPSPGLSDELRADLGRHAVAGAQAIGYVGAGTMEFLVDPDGRATFMEINGRIQVEHPVTEMLTGLDLIAEQLRVASGEPLGYGQDDVRPRGAAIECRINAEDPDRGFAPTPGRLTELRQPGGPGVRIDSGFVQGDTVSPHYDSLIAKLIVWAPTREQAIARADRALAEYVVEGPGVRTTIPLLRRLITDPDFAAARHTTRFVDGLLVADRDEQAA